MCKKHKKSNLTMDWANDMQYNSKREYLKQKIFFAYWGSIMEKQGRK